LQRMGLPRSVNYDIRVNQSQSLSPCCSPALS
jgi:hypothetical protein